MNDSKRNSSFVMNEDMSLENYAAKEDIEFNELFKFKPESIKRNDINYAQYE